MAHLGSYGRFGVERRTIRRGMDEVRRALGWLHALGGDVLVVISGGRDGASWEDAARAYADAYAALLPEAASAGIRLAIEVIHPLRQDLSFINTLADAREIARARGAWRRLRARLLALRLGAPAARHRSPATPRRRIHAVQISDYKRVTMRTLDRALLGRGILPLRRAAWARSRRGGYRGWYEAEIISDDVERSGYETVLRRTRTAFARLLAGLQPTRGRRERS